MCVRFREESLQSLSPISKTVITSMIYSILQAPKDNRINADSLWAIAPCRSECHWSNASRSNTASERHPRIDTKRLTDFRQIPAWHLWWLYTTRVSQTLAAAHRRVQTFSKQHFPLAEIESEFGPSSTGIRRTKDSCGGAGLDQLHNQIPVWSRQRKMIAWRWRFQRERCCRSMLLET